MNEWIPVVISIVINVAVVAFAFGKFSKSIENLEKRMGVSDAATIRKNEKTEAWEHKMEDKQLVHSMIPECVTMFQGINSKLGELTGSIDTLIRLVKNGAK